jgi:hypothetical protein
MSLSSRVKNKIVDTINTTFATIGNANGMRMPKSSDNREPAAWELYVAHHVLSLATKRKEQAEKAAIAAGVIIDKEKHPRPGGTREVVFNGDVVSVSLEVRQPSERVSAPLLCDYLNNKGVSRQLLDEAVAAVTTTTKPAHVFSTMLITNGS